MRCSLVKEGKIWSKHFIAVSLCSFFVYLNVYMLTTTIPLYVKDALQGSEQQMGLSITLWSLGVILFRLFSGRWVERIGMRRLSIVSVLLFFCTTVLYFSVSALAILLIIRVMHGGTFAVGATATSTMATHLTPEHRKAEGIGYFSLFMSISMVIGPAFGIMLWNRYEDGNILFMASMVISCLALVCIMLAQMKEEAPVPQMKPKRMSWDRLIEKKTLPIALVGFVLSFSYSSLTSFISVFMVEQEQAYGAPVFFIVFALMIIVSRLFLGKATDRYGEHWIVYPGVLCFALGMLLLSHEKTGSMLVLSAAMLGLGYGALFPCLQTLAVQTVETRRRGVATSTFFLFYDIGFGVGALMLGWVAGQAGYRMMFILAAFVVIVCAILYYYLCHRPIRELRHSKIIESKPGA